MGSLPQSLSKPTPIPSKAALRVLRQIALSPLTLTVGGLCGAYGVTLLDFETRRKIHSAQTALENKRILRSITHGRGEAYIQAMFEAAERGEDLALFKKNYAKTLHTRPLTSLAHQVQEDPSENLPVNLHQDHSIENDTQRHGPVPIQQKSLHTFTPFKTSTNHQPKRLVTTEPFNVVDTRLRSNPRHTNHPRRVPRGIHQYGKSRPGSEWHESSPTLFSPFATSFPTRSHIPGRTFQLPYRPFNELENHLSRTDQPTPTKGTPPWLSTNPKQSPLVECSDQVRRIVETNSNTVTESFSPTCLSSLHSELAHELLHTSSNKDDINLISDFIFGQEHSTGLSIALRWMSVLEHFMNAGTDLDFDLAEGWFLRYRSYFPIAMVCTPPVLRIVERHLSRDPTSNRAAEILYPSHSAYLWRDHRGADDQAQAISYLEYFAQTSPDFTTQGLELDKIIDMARARNVSLNDALLVPLLNSLIDAKRTPHAHQLLHLAEERYAISINQNSLELVAMSYAANQKWERTSEVINDMHVKGHSRLLPTRFQAFFARLLEYRGRYDLAEHCITYAMEHVKLSGLVACHDVTRAVVCVALREGRHELIAEWGRFVEKMFLRVEMGYSDTTTVTDFVRVWEELGISCAEIASACRAMAIGARSDPFGPYMRSSVWNLLRKDLSYRVEPFLNQLTTKHDLNAMPTDSLIKLAEEICRSATSTEETASLNGIRVQLEGIADLKKTFRGEHSPDLFDSETFRKRSPTYHQYRRPKAPMQIQHDSKAVVSQNVPTTPSSIATALAEHYAKTGRKSQDTHSLLKLIVRKLTSSYRMTQALHLLERVYSSNYVQGQFGTPFDEHLFSEWLSLAYKYGPEGSGITALWAVIDSYRHLDFSQHFFMLTNEVHRTETRKKFGTGSVHISGMDIRELRYLRGRLTILRSSTSSLTEDPVGLDAWQPWEELLKKPPPQEMEFMVL